MGEADQNVKDKPAARTIMPPYLVLRDFLPEETAAGLLDFALAHEADFAPTKTGDGQDGGVKPDIRVSLGTRELGPFKPILKDKLRALVPDLVARLRVTPVDDPKFELELVAHNDGAFYTQHIDTQTASDSGSMRVLSGVYYFHAEPKAFSGGALRLYAIGDPDKKTFVDIAPEHNTLLVFPSWAPHEVMPIGCPSGRFADSRFAINCWVHRKTAAAVTSPSENDAGARMTSEEEEVLSMKFGGRTIRENLEAAIAAGRVIRLPDGKLSLPTPPPMHPMQFTNYGIMDRDCTFLNRFMFNHIYGRSSVPLGCAACYKLKVETQTMRQLMAIKEIADDCEYRARSGAEVDRPDNQSLYATYFYLTGLHQARDVYKQVRAKVDADPALGRSIKMIIKRGCTNYERACGPSDRYTFDPRLEAVEAYVRKRYVPPERPPRPARKYRYAATLLQTARIAFRIGDNTYKDFFGGQEMFPPTVSYDPDVADDDDSSG